MIRTYVVVLSLLVCVACAKKEEGANEARLAAGDEKVTSSAPPPVITRGIGDLKMSPPGAHTVNPTDTPKDFVNSGSIADCSGGSEDCLGRQQMYEQVSDYLDDDEKEVVTGVKVTPINDHRKNGFDIPAGWRSFGAVSDCGGGYCQGHQLLLYKKEKFGGLESKKPFVSNIALSPDQCPKGKWESVGRVRTPARNFHLCVITELKGSSSEVSSTEKSEQAGKAFSLPSRFVGNVFWRGQPYRVYRSVQKLSKIVSAISDWKNVVQCARGSMNAPATTPGKAIIRFADVRIESAQGAVACVALHSDGTQSRLVANEKGIGIDNAAKLDQKDLPQEALVTFEQYTSFDLSLDPVGNCAANEVAGSDAKAFGCNNLVVAAAQDSPISTFAAGHFNQVVANRRVWVSGSRNHAQGSAIDIVGNDNFVMGESISITGDRNQTTGTGINITGNDKVINKAE